jgi:parallel beta-helix repeat protein
LNGKHCQIIHNYINSTYSKGISISEISDSNTISGNIISGCGDVGIYIRGSGNNKILDNRITRVHPGYGIQCDSYGNYICGNNFSFCSTALYVGYYWHTNISGNNFYSNGGGIQIWESGGNIVFKNNFIENGYAVTFHYVLGQNRNKFMENYWDKHHWFGPKIIFGDILGLYWFNFDWHPAKKPYDIPGVR